MSSQEIGVDFNEDVKVNRFKLEIAAESHSTVFLFYSEKLGEAKTAFSQAKDHLEYIKAKTELDYRQMANPPVKITADSVEALVNTHENVIAAKDALTAAQKDWNTYEAAVRAMEHRKGQIDNLVKLWISGYYSNPNGHDRTSEMKAGQRNALNHKETDNG
jgi:hypothetical protein